MNGKILRVKQGFNPNSSSMGSIIFALPVSLIAVSFTLAAVSGVILPYFIKDDHSTQKSDESKKDSKQKES
ncbi:uncharacterized protein Dvar_11910 [Desulfosarcina variabilis str. Montpellier]|jgi:hypothetical protein|uniref:hypothetical protein n=1 Tax=Desulfosarcina variabilis TaxID=2300 RepID=UPI003AFB68B1